MVGVWVVVEAEARVVALLGDVLAHIAQMGWYFVARVPGTVRLRTTDGMQTPCATGHLSKAHRLIPIAESKFIKSRTNVNPLLQVPPASRGNQVGARLGSPREAGGTLRRGGNSEILNARLVLSPCRWGV